MPINDPINNRKVAPGSLAFERRRLSPFGQAYAIDDPDGDVYNYLYRPRFERGQTTASR